MTNSNPESPAAATQDAVAPPSNFLRDIIAEDVRTKKYGDAIVQTRFPPEPNGYLHIGHAKAICIDFGLADEFGGKTNLRFDDTNPEKEEQEYVDSIMADVRWLGFEWDRLCYASDYFGQLYEWALQLVKSGKAYVDDLSADEIRQHRGTLTEPGTDSPYRTRSIEENLDLFTRMKQGEFPDGTRVLRAKIDMAASSTPRTSEPATSGASTPCTTTRTASRTRWSALPTPCALWSLRITSPSTAGTSSSLASSPRSR